ncbi:phosphocarrier protein [Paenibacillus mucilaginosus]|uniref:HPr family phosphocarrier protein n=1 Tax=Paenibacillus mucilaginosus TaxID=61624 RepID=UPI003D219075
MIRQSFIITDQDGFHARSANDLVYTANRFLDCALFAEHGGKRVTLHSILGVLSLSARPGDELLLTAEGGHEAEAMEALQGVMIRERIGRWNEE